MSANKNQNRNAEAQSPAGLCCDVWLECVIRIEHGWLCIRNRSGWLLWSAKAKEVDTHQGVVMADLTPEITKRQAEWQRDHDEIEAAEHPNEKVS